ncbi:hypothetical protein GOODEAATRI_030410 [Goodea atripinnis]|uniref:Uncharacterized protein n=1 Tax=Goodea atripinnis TaxID=208336 RepID=A0ABV0P8Z9_9TELE
MYLVVRAVSHQVSFKQHTAQLPVRKTRRWNGVDRASLNAPRQKNSCVKPEATQSYDVSNTLCDLQHVWHKSSSDVRINNTERTAVYQHRGQFPTLLNCCSYESE